MQFVYRQMRDTRHLMLMRAFVLSLLLVAVMALVSQLVGNVRQTISYAKPPMGSFQMGITPAGPTQPDQKNSSRLLPMVADEENSSIAKTLSIQIAVDGTTVAHSVANGTTVEALLQEIGIVCGEYDRVNPPLNKILRKDGEIVIQRVVFECVTVNELIPYETLYRDSSLLKEGEIRLAQEGKNGSRTVLYDQCFVDGELESETEQQVTVHNEAKEEIILVGAQVAISPLEFEDIPLDENGVPLAYTQVLTEQVATGYSARRGAKTASGRYAIPGHVAVDPEDIPYGSRLYIASPDNSFVYGYAVAADTGVGLMQDIIDIDLFYDTYRESAMNGRKIVNIYVLE